MAELQIATVRAQVMFSLFTDFENFSTFKPAAMHEGTLKTMVDQLVTWASAMKSVRSPELAGAKR